MCVCLVGCPPWVVLYVFYVCVPHRSFLLVMDDLLECKSGSFPNFPSTQGLTIEHLWAASAALALLGGSTLSVRVGGSVAVGDESAGPSGMVVALDGSLAESTVPPNAVEVCNFWESIAYASEVRHCAREAHAPMFVSIGNFFCHRLCHFGCRPCCRSLFACLAGLR